MKIERLYCDCCGEDITSCPRCASARLTFRDRTVPLINHDLQSLCVGCYSLLVAAVDGVLRRWAPRKQRLLEIAKEKDGNAMDGKYPLTLEGAEEHYSSPPRAREKER